MCTTSFSFSTMCTGMRIVRALSAIARVTAWRLDRQVELRRLHLLGERLLVRERLVLLALDELDAVVDQVGGEVLQLLLGVLELVHTGDDLVVGEEALLLPGLDELL